MTLNGVMAIIRVISWEFGGFEGQLLYVKTAAATHTVHDRNVAQRISFLQYIIHDHRRTLVHIFPSSWPLNALERRDIFLLHLPGRVTYHRVYRATPLLSTTTAYKLRCHLSNS